jgi:hypothetical protein
VVEKKGEARGNASAARPRRRIWCLPHLRAGCCFTERGWRGGVAGADGEAAQGHVEDGEEEDDSRRGRSGAADGIGRWRP